MVRGMQVLGSFLADGCSGAANCNTTLGKQLLQNAKTLNAAVEASIDYCTVTESATEVFLPPYGAVNATPYPNMTDGREASYANFRFYSEAILADLMPREIEGQWVTRQSSCQCCHTGHCIHTYAANCTAQAQMYKHKCTGTNAQGQMHKDKQNVKCIL